MDNELFELCKEVYKRFPKWNDTERVIIEMNDPSGGIIFGRSNNGKLPKSERFYAPLYTSDYLLEKLPKRLKIREGTAWLSFYPLEVEPGAWGCSYDIDGDMTSESQSFYQVWAEKPLKALLKLTLALHESGEL